MLDSSPPPAPPPKKLKRTASMASLPSPPPSVEHVKKRTTSQRFTNCDSDSNNESGSDEEATEAVKVVGRKLLFPQGPSTSSVVAAHDSDPDNPFLDHTTPLDARDQLALDAASSPSAHRAAAPASPPPSRRRTAKPHTVPPRTPSPVGCGGVSAASKMPSLDKEDNPFLADTPPKLRHPRSPRDFEEPPTLTYVFKGVKTSFPNPNYNLPESAHERSRLPLSDPDYSPLPTHVPRKLFPEAYPIAGDAEDEDAGSSDGADEVQTPVTRPRMSKVFVDGKGDALPDSGPEGVRGKTMDAREIGRMAVGPIRGRG